MGVRKLGVHGLAFSIGLWPKIGQLFCNFPASLLIGLFPIKQLYSLKRLKTSITNITLKVSNFFINVTSFWNKEFLSARLFYRQLSCLAIDSYNCEILAKTGAIPAQPHIGPFLIKIKQLMMKTRLSGMNSSRVKGAGQNLWGIRAGTVNRVRKLFFKTLTSREMLTF